MVDPRVTATEAGARPGARNWRSGGERRMVLKHVFSEVTSSYPRQGFPGAQ